MNKHFQTKIEGFLHKFRVMSNDEFLEAVPDIQDEICDLWDQIQEMKKQSGKVVITLCDGDVTLAKVPNGFITGVSLHDYDVPVEYEGEDVKQDEDGKRFQEMDFYI